MIKCFSLLFLSGLLLFSCKKSGADNVPNSLEGAWKMVLVKDITTNSFITKPSSIQKDVILTFHPADPSTGTVTGETPSNEIGPSTYSIGENQAISIPALFMTKVAETSWGAEFVDNIRHAQQYSFNAAGKLNIRTTNKILTFQKL